MLVGSYRDIEDELNLRKYKKYRRGEVEYTRIAGWERILPSTRRRHYTSHFMCFS